MEPQPLASMERTPEVERLMEKGCSVLCLDCPEKMLFGIDYAAWTVGPRFMGVKLVPPGLHFIYCSASAEDVGIARTGFFLHMKPQEVAVFRWDPDTEELVLPTDQDEMSRYADGVRSFDFDANLGPYPIGLAAEWEELTRHATPELVSKIEPVSKKIRSKRAEYDGEVPSASGPVKLVAAAAAPKAADAEAGDDDDAEMGDGDALEAPTFNRGGQTFEQQLKDGYRPVYQGSSVVAMVKNGDLVKPGRRAEGGKGKGDKGKGKDGGKGRDDWDDFGKGGSGGYGDGKGKGKGKGKGDGFSNAGNGGWQPQRPPSGVKRWMVAVKEEVIVKESHLVTSGQVGRLHSGDVVTQTADEQVIEHGIVRMPIEHRVPGGTIIRGWVTRTAEAASGPCYFRQVGGGGFEDYGGGKGGGGGHGYGGGKGYSPGKGNGKYGGGFN